MDYAPFEGAGAGPYQGPTKCGALMGSPLAWPLLNLVNLYCWEKACKEFRAENSKRGEGAPRTHYPVVVCGDDLLGLSPKGIS